MNAFLEHIETKLQTNQRLTMHEQVKLRAYAQPCRPVIDLNELLAMARRNLA